MASNDDHELYNKAIDYLKVDVLKSVNIGDKVIWAGCRTIAAMIGDGEFKSGVAYEVLRKNEEEYEFTLKTEDSEETLVVGVDDILLEC